MKFKEIDRTASVAWSPATVDNIYLAAGTAAQQLDSSFSTNAVVEIYQLNVNEPGLDVPVKATYTSENRFHKLVWGSHGIGGDKNEYPSGIIVGGCDGGVMQVLCANKLFQNEDPVVLTKTKHTGPVRALDFNCYRSNLIASGATESEIFIWDLNNPKVPMSPGAKIQPSDDVTDLEWNKQVEHILASTFPARCVVWDLRKNEPVIKVSDSSARIRYKCVRWHPEVATQMCLASEDDASPVIQLWDLRYATSPLKVIQGHQRGILGMSWCAQDPELLLSCGKDSRILCWNPNFPHPGYEMVLDIPTASQWSFDVSFCPRNPLVFSTSTFDGRITIHGLSGGAQQPVTSSKLADSFPGMDMSISNAPVPAQQTAPQQLRDPPKWLKRPSGVSFAFGGRLVSFQNVKIPSNQAGVPDKITGAINISQVVTLPSFIERSKKLEEALHTGSLEYYCAEKARIANDEKETHIWEFLQASFSQNPRQAYVSLLGFNTSEMLNKLQDIIRTEDVDALTNSFGALGGGQSNQSVGDVTGSVSAYQNGIDSLSASESVPEFALPTDESVDGKINQAILCGSIDIAVNLCLENERWADALLLASKGSSDLMTKAQSKYFQKRQGQSTNMIRAVVRNDLSHLVSNCTLENWKQALATSLTYADHAEFQRVAETLGMRLLESKNDNHRQGALLCFICSGSLNKLVDAWMGGSGKATSPDELQDLVEQVMVLKKAAEMWGLDPNISGGSLAGKMVEYASTLASQGCLETALSYLKDSSEPTMDALKDRLQLSLGFTRPTRSQLAPRSRQSSESSGYRSIHKRPSHPSAPVKRASDMYQPNDFSNLTGPVHPPSAPTYNSSSNIPSGYGQPAQYSPVGLPPTNAPGLLTYAQPGVPGTVGLPPKPPSATPAPLPTLYNPAEAIPENSPQLHEPLQRKASGGALPKPPVSNVASGWNDPPPIMVKSKPSQQQTSQQMITHPIFGSAPEPTGMNVNAAGNLPGMGTANPQAPYGNPLPPPPTAASRSYGTATPSAVSQPYGSMAMPPPPSNGIAQPYGMFGSVSEPVNVPGMPPTASGLPPANPGAAYGNPLPPPPTAVSRPYGTATPSGVSQPYGNMAMPPPPSSGIAQPYGMVGSASEPAKVPGMPPTVPGGPPANPVPPPPTAASRAYGTATPSGLSQPYGSMTMPPPPQSGIAQPYGMFGSASEPANVSRMPPTASGLPPANPGAPYCNPVPPPPTAAMRPYAGATPPIGSGVSQAFGTQAIPHNQ